MPAGAYRQSRASVTVQRQADRAVQTFFVFSFLYGREAAVPITNSAAAAANSAGKEISPERLPPCEIMDKPRTTTRTDPADETAFAALLPITDTREPKPSIRGTVPRLKTSMEAAPVSGLAEASATICMD